MPPVTEFAAQLPFLLSVSPLFGALWTWLNGRRDVPAVRQAAITNATLTLALAVWMATQFVLSHSPAVEMASMFPWWSAPLGGEPGSESAAKMSFVLAFGVDGLSVIPLIVIALVGWVAIVTADRCATPWTSASYVELLIGQSLALAIFAAQDFVMFVIGCELWAWWAFFAIGRQGGLERRAAALRWRVAAAAAHAAWSLAGIGCAVCYAWIQSELHGGTGTVWWLLPEIVSRLARWIGGNETAFYAWTAFQPWVLPLWLIGLFIRWPVFPFHGWWTAMMSEARSPIAALFTSAMVLQNGYALLRFVIPLFPPGEAGWAAFVLMWVSFGAAYFGLLALSQTESRRIAASVSLFAIHAAILGLLSGNVETCLAAWQSLAVMARAHRRRLPAARLAGNEYRFGRRGHCLRRCVHSAAMEPVRDDFLPVARRRPRVRSRFRTHGRRIVGNPYARNPESDAAHRRTAGRVGRAADSASLGIRAVVEPETRSAWSRIADRRRHRGGDVGRHVAGIVEAVGTAEFRSHSQSVRRGRCRFGGRTKFLKPSSRGDDRETDFAAAFH